MANIYKGWTLEKLEEEKTKLMEMAKNNLEAYKENIATSSPDPEVIKKLNEEEMRLVRDGVALEAMLADIDEAIAEAKAKLQMQ